MDILISSDGVVECVSFVVGDGVGLLLTEAKPDVDFDGVRVRLGVTVTDAGSAVNVSDLEDDSEGSFEKLA